MYNSKRWISGISKISSFTMKNIPRHSTRFFSSLAKQNGRSLRKSYPSWSGWRCFCKENLKKNLNEKSHKQQSDLSDSSSVSKNQTKISSKSDEVQNSIYFKVCADYNNNENETITIVVNKYELCRGIGLMPSTSLYSADKTIEHKPDTSPPKKTSSLPAHLVDAKTLPAVQPLLPVTCNSVEAKVQSPLKVTKEESTTTISFPSSPKEPTTEKKPQISIIASNAPVVPTANSVTTKTQTSIHATSSPASQKEPTTAEASQKPNSVFMNTNLPTQATKVNPPSKTQTTEIAPQKPTIKRNASTDLPAPTPKMKSKVELTTSTFSAKSNLVKKKSKFSPPSPPPVTRILKIDSRLSVTTEESLSFSSKTSPVSAKNKRMFVDKLTDEEIREICRTKCPCHNCGEPQISSKKTQSYLSYKGKSLGYRSATSNRKTEGISITGSKVSSKPNHRKGKPNQQKPKLNPAQQFQLHGNSGERIYASIIKIPNVRGVDQHLHQTSPMKFKSSYERMKRSNQKRQPSFFKPKALHLRHSNTSGGVPYMSSNQSLVQTTLRRKPSIYQHKNTRKPASKTPLEPWTVFPVPVLNYPRKVAPVLKQNPNDPPPSTSFSKDRFNQSKTMNNTEIKSNVSTAKNTDKSKNFDFKLTENRSAMVLGPKQLQLVVSKYPQLSNDKDIIIQMEYVNLTNEDARHYLTGKQYTYSFNTTIAGRSGVGIVIEIGKDVHNVQPGDKVLIKAIRCGKCSICLTGRGSLCEYVSNAGTTPYQGTLTHFLVHPSKFVTKISDAVNSVSAVVTGTTLSSAIRACQKAAVTAGDNVLVIDGGPLGVTTALTAKSMGATAVCIADARKTNLEQALKLGIDRIFLIDPRSPLQNTAIKIWEQFGEYPRLTFDCRGSQLTNEIAICATKTGGKSIFMQNDVNDTMISVTNAVMRDVDIIISTIGSDESERAAIQLLNNGRANIEVYHQYDLLSVDEAFQHLLDLDRLRSHVIVECRIKKDADKEMKTKIVKD